MTEQKKVIFTDTRKTVSLELPSFPGSQVIVYTELNIGQQRAIANATDNFDRGLAAAQVAIKEWNLFQDENTPLEISTENLKRFPEGDMMVIFSAVTGKTKDELLDAANGKENKNVKKNTETESAK